MGCPLDSGLAEKTVNPDASQLANNLVSAPAFAVRAPDKPNVTPPGQPFASAVTADQKAAAALAAPTSNGVHTNITGTILAGEGGASVTVTGWYENTNATFYLHNTNFHWQVYNVATIGWTDNNTYACRTTSNWGTTDRPEMSLANNFDITLRYYKTVHNRNSFNNAGILARANAHQGVNYVNAYWDGSAFYFGDGDNTTASSLAVLDVAGHEFTHAVTEYTAGLIYSGESGGAKVSVFNTTNSTFYIGSNGYITFGAGDNTYSESLANHFNQLRISALFDDLYPTTGQVTWKQLSDRVAVTWLNVPEYGTSNQNSFQIEMFFDGRIRITWLGIAATDGLAGLSRGTGTPAGFVESDLSSYGPCTAPDLSLTLTGAPNPVGLGTNLTYSIAVTNLGTAAASSVTVTDSLPASVTFVAASPGCVYSAGKVICDLGTISSGAKSNVSIIVAPTLRGVITNSAVVTSATAESILTNNTATTTTTVTGPPSTNASLANLVPSAGTLSPAFASNVFSYTASVLYAVTGLTVTPTAADPTATIQVNGTNVVSGTASSPVNLSVGNNLITTVVVSEDQSVTHTYSLTVVRAASITRWWDGGTTNIVGTGDGVSQGGAGTWDTTIQNWDQGSGEPHGAWDNAGGNIASFGGTAGTVTLDTGITVGGLVFNTASYLITSNAITLTPGAVLNSTVGTDTTTTPNITSVLAGSAGFTKTGSGWLQLNATTNSLGGDIMIQQGTLYARHAALGTGGIVFTGNSTFIKVYNSDNNMPATMSVTVNPGVSATISGATFYYNANFAGALVGATNSSLTVAPGGNVEFQFNNTSNTFQGQLTLNGSGTADSGSRVVFKSLPDSSQKIQINNAVLRLANGGVDLNFQNRPIEILHDARLDNDSTNTNVEFTIAQNLIATIGNNARTLYLTGVNTGNNTFAGAIGNSSNGSGTVSLSKEEAGTWILSRTNNTYSGKTTVKGGTLVVTALKNIGQPSSIGVGGALQLGYYNTAGTLRYVGAGDTTDRPVQLNDYTTGTGNTAAGIILNDGSGALVFTATEFIPTNGTVAANRSLILGGNYTNSANEIRGIIQDIRPAPATGMVSLVKQDLGTWNLSGNNTYTGPTTINGGTLLINGALAGAGGAVTVNSGGTLGGTGTVTRTVTIANGATLSPGHSAGTLTVSNLVLQSSSVLAYELGTNSDQTVVTGALTLDGTLHVTDAGGLANGNYPLFTYDTLTDNTLTVGTMPGSFSGTISNDTVLKRILLVVTGGSGPPPVAGFTPSATSGVAPLTVNFTDTSTGAPTHWYWSFGDGGTSTNQHPTHTYAAGTWPVSLIASNAAGASSPATAIITVITPEQSWANRYGLAADAGDADGDGLSNWAEFLTGFNPTNPAAFARIISVTKSGNDLVITYLGANGDTTYDGGPFARTNVLEFTTVLGDTNQFSSTGQTNILSGGTGTGAVTSFIETNGLTFTPARYYRVRVLAP